MGLLMLRLRPLFYTSSLSETFASPGAYALVGAVSFLGGVTQTNIALIVILIEVTKTSAALALPFLLSLAIAKLLSARTQQGGFYAALIRFKRQPYFFHETQVSYRNSAMCISWLLFMYSCYHQGAHVVNVTSS